MARVLIIVDHGSRLADANAVVEQTARAVQAALGARALVRHAHMELAEPLLGTVLDEAVAGGAQEVVVVPLFLAPGKHAGADIPAAVARARARHTQVLFRITSVLGPDALLVDLVVKRAGLV
jgi:sirohydrochlorin ferrochelatase